MLTNHRRDLRCLLFSLALILISASDGFALAATKTSKTGRVGPTFVMSPTEALAFSIAIEGIKQKRINVKQFSKVRFFSTADQFHVFFSVKFGETKITPYIAIVNKDSLKLISVKPCQDLC